MAFAHSKILNFLTIRSFELLENIEEGCRVLEVRGKGLLEKSRAENRKVITMTTYLIMYFTVPDFCLNFCC